MHQKNPLKCPEKNIVHIDFKSRFWDILMDLFDATVWLINGHVDVEHTAVCQIGGTSIVEHSAKTF